MEYSFLLRYRLHAAAADADELVERLGAAGCEDALVGIGIPGRLALRFTREADSAEAALLSAIHDVRDAVPEASLVEAEPDLVGLTDAADLIGVSRQNLHKLMKRHAGSFPSPVHEGSMAIWHLAELLEWLRTHQDYEMPPGMEELAATAKQVNLARQVREIEPKVSAQVRSLI